MTEREEALSWLDERYERILKAAERYTKGRDTLEDRQLLARSGVHPRRPARLKYRTRL